MHMIERKIDTNQAEEAMKELRGKLPEGKFKKIESDIKSHFDDGSSHLTEQELDEKMYFYEINPSHGIRKEDTDQVKDAFEGEFEK